MSLNKMDLDNLGKISKSFVMDMVGVIDSNMTSQTIFHMYDDYEKILNSTMQPMDVGISTKLNEYVL